jgi:MFS family permease
MVASFLTPSIIKKFGLRQSLVLGAILFGLVTLCQIFPACYDAALEDPAAIQNKWYTWFMNKTIVQVILVVSSIFSGLGAGLIWVSQGEYISKCTTESSKGFYFGYFWAWYMSAQIIGNLTGGILITKSSGIEFFVIMGAMALTFSFNFCFLKTP